jgi:hypothetical protein
MPNSIGTKPLSGFRTESAYVLPLPSFTLTTALVSLEGADRKTLIVLSKKGDMKSRTKDR